MTVSGTGQPKYSGLGLPLTVLQAGLEADRAAVTLEPGLPPSGSSRSRYCENAATRGLRPGDALGDRVVFGLLGDRHAEELVGLALDAELGQVDRQVRR